MPFPIHPDLIKVSISDDWDSKFNILKLDPGSWPRPYFPYYLLHSFSLFFIFLKFDLIGQLWSMEGIKACTLLFSLLKMHSKSLWLGPMGPSFWPVTGSWIAFECPPSLSRIYNLVKVGYSLFKLIRFVTCSDRAPRYSGMCSSFAIPTLHSSPK